MFFRIASAINITASIDKKDLPDVFSKLNLKYEPENFVYFWCIAMHGDVTNGNGDMFPSDELAKSYQTFKKRGLYLEHDSDSVTKMVGDIVESIWDEKNKRILLFCRVDKHIAPEIAQKVKDGIIKTVSMGCVVDKAICEICENVATNMNNLCVHMKPGTAEYCKGQKRDNKIIAEINRDITFQEISLVAYPADPDAFILEVIAKVKQANSVKFSHIYDNGLVCIYAAVNDNKPEKIYEVTIEEFKSLNIEIESLKKELNDLTRKLSAKVTQASVDRCDIRAFFYNKNGKYFSELFLDPSIISKCSGLDIKDNKYISPEFNTLIELKESILKLMSDKKIVSCKLSPFVFNLDGLKKMDVTISNINKKETPTMTYSNRSIEISNTIKKQSFYRLVIHSHPYAMKDEMKFIKEELEYKTIRKRDDSHIELIVDDSSKDTIIKKLESFGMAPSLVEQI